MQPLLRAQRTSGKDLPGSPFPGRKGITKEGVYGHKGGWLVLKRCGRLSLEQGYESLMVKGHIDAIQILSIVLGLGFVLSASVLQDLHEPEPNGPPTVMGKPLSLLTDHGKQGAIGELQGKVRQEGDTERKGSLVEVSRGPDSARVAMGSALKTRLAWKELVTAGVLANSLAKSRRQV